MNKFEKAITAIDQKNAEDPNIEVHEGKEFPKELLYSQRMSQKLLEFDPGASEELQIAVRAQHICRWKFPRDHYPMNRVGYLQWREELKNIHAGIISEILEKVGYDQEFIDRVAFLVKKKSIKRDTGSQTMEDVACLVFLQYYFEDFAAKHEDQKVTDIVGKSWFKMSAEGRRAALELPLFPDGLKLVEKALKQNNDGKQ